MENHRKEEREREREEREKVQERKKEEKVRNGLGGRGGTVFYDRLGLAVIYPPHPPFGPCTRVMLNT